MLPPNSITIIQCCYFCRFLNPMASLIEPVFLYFDSLPTLRRSIDSVQMFFGVMTLIRSFFIVKINFTCSFVVDC